MRQNRLNPVLAHNIRLPRNPHHHRHIRAIDIRIDQPNPVPQLPQRNPHIPHTPLTPPNRHHIRHAGQRLRPLRCSCSHMSHNILLILFATPYTLFPTPCTQTCQPAPSDARISFFLCASPPVLKTPSSGAPSPPHPAAPPAGFPRDPPPQTSDKPKKHALTAAPSHP